MKFRLPQGLTALGLLYRLLVLLRQLTRAQERLADSAELELKLKLLQTQGGTLQDLRGASYESGEAEVERYDPEDLALRRQLLEEAEARGWRLEPGADVVDVFEKEGFLEKRRAERDREQ